MSGIPHREDLPTLSLVVRLRFPLLFSNFSCLRVNFKVQNRTETLQIGSVAPDFSLGAANREGVVTLANLLAGGTLILEFLRGTW